MPTRAEGVGLRARRDLVIRPSRKVGVHTTAHRRVTDKRAPKPKNTAKNTTGQLLKPRAKVGSSQDYHIRGEERCME